MTLKLKLRPSSETMEQGDAAMPYTNQLGLVSLEPRILLDAAGFITGADIAMEAMVAENVDFGVEAIFGGDDAATFEASSVDVQNSELLSSLAVAPIGENDNPSAAPLDHPWLGTGSDVVAAAPLDHPWLGNGDDGTAAAPLDHPWLGTGSDVVAAAPLDHPWLGNGDDGTAAAPLDHPWLGNGDDGTAAAPLDHPWL